MNNTDWAKKYLEKAEDDLISNESGIYIQASIASALIAIAEELAKVNIKFDNVCYELKSANEGERK